MKDIWYITFDELKDNIQELENNKYEGMTDDMFREYLNLFAYKIDIEPILRGNDFTHVLDYKIMRDKVLYAFNCHTYGEPGGY